MQEQTRHTFKYVWGIKLVWVPLLRDCNLGANLGEVCPSGEVVYAVRHYHQELVKYPFLDALSCGERIRITYVLYLIL